MNPDQFNNEPLAKILAFVSKQYVGVASKKLSKLDIKRYYYALLIIEEEQPDITQQMLADIMKIDKVSVFRMVDYFCKYEILERKVNIEDRRSQYLQLTERGKKITPLIRKIYKEVNATAFNGISKEEKAAFFKILGKISSNLEAAPNADIKIDLKELGSAKPRKVLSS
ncbi:MAG: MarR family transcriptional regulator [Cryomorphaceae bacterium]|nr:MarR family transcriptional regulator [Cryomorphaceae bacterium]